MRHSIVLVTFVVSASLGAGLSSGSSEDPNADVSLVISGCAATPAHDSVNFISFFRAVVSRTEQGFDSLRAHANLPFLPADSVQYGGTAVQCDSISARYTALRETQTGDDWPLRPVKLLRVGPTRWVADPLVGDGNSREWVILDSTLAILKVWETTGM